MNTTLKAGRRSGRVLPTGSNHFLTHRQILLESSLSSDVLIPGYIVSGGWGSRGGSLHNYTEPTDSRPGLSTGKERVTQPPHQAMILIVDDSFRYRSYTYGPTGR